MSAPGAFEPPKATVGAATVVRNDQGHVLLCHRDDADVWDLPGGFIGEHESPWESGVRETLDEARVHF